MKYIKFHRDFLLLHLYLNSLKIYHEFCFKFNLFGKELNHLPDVAYQNELVDLLIIDLNFTQLVIHIQFLNYTITFLVSTLVIV